MIKLSVWFLMLFMGFVSLAQTDDLMIVEYQDYDPGDGFQIKILNPTTASINLGSYYLQVFNNGNITASSSSQLSGILLPGQTLIVGNNHTCSNDLSFAVAGVNNNDCIAITLGNTLSFIDMINLYGVNVQPRIDNQSNAMFHKKLVRNSGNCIRYTSTDGSSSNSWKSSSSVNNPGWTVSGTTCLTSGSTFQPGPTAAEAFNACEGDTLYFPVSGAVVTKDTNFIEMRSNPLGCDSVITVNAMFNSAPSATKNYTACSGDIYNYNGMNISTDTSFVEQVNNPSGCDSLITININFKPLMQGTRYFNACEGDVLNHIGLNIQKDTTFTYTATNPGSCDSVITVVATFNSLPEGFETYEFCTGTLVDIDGNLISEDTLIMEKRNSPSGCDSLITMSVQFVGFEAEGNWKYVNIDSTLVAAFNKTPGNVKSTTFIWGDDAMEELPGAVSGSHEYMEPGNYLLDIISESNEGCLDTVSFSVFIPGKDVTKTLYIPNVFTPNGDGINDLFKVNGTEVSDYHIQIFTRWGQLIFESSDIEKPWDGKFNNEVCSEGTYMYHIYTEKSRDSGFLTLLR